MEGMKDALEKFKGRDFDQESSCYKWCFVASKLIISTIPLVCYFIFMSHYFITISEAQYLVDEGFYNESDLHHISTNLELSLIIAGIAAIIGGLYYAFYRDS